MITIQKRPDFDTSRWESSGLEIDLVDTIADAKPGSIVLESSMEFCEQALGRGLVVHYLKLNWIAVITALKKAGIPCLNGQYVHKTSDQIADGWQKLCDKFHTNALFIRPVYDKVFPALNYARLGGSREFLDMAGRGKDAIAAQSKKIAAEYRFFIANAQIVTGSMYKSQDDVYYSDYIPPEVSDLAAKAAKVNIGMSHYTLDIAVTSENQASVLEANCWSSSGTYDCDLKKIADNS